jgi:hypothetical protein
MVTRSTQRPAGCRHVGLALLMNPARFGPNPHHRQHDKQHQRRRQQPWPSASVIFLGGGGFVFHSADYFPGAPAAQWLFGRREDKSRRHRGREGSQDNFRPLESGAARDVSEINFTQQSGPVGGHIRFRGNTTQLAGEGLQVQLNLPLGDFAARAED